MIKAIFKQCNSCQTKAFSKENARPFEEYMYWQVLFTAFRITFQTHGYRLAISHVTIYSYSPMVDLVDILMNMKERRIKKIAQANYEFKCIFTLR